MICNYSSQITNDKPETATIIIDDSEADNDWPALVNSLRSEKLKLAQSLHAMMAEKESLAMSLEGRTSIENDSNHENEENHNFQDYPTVWKKYTKTLGEL